MSLKFSWFISYLDATPPFPFQHFIPSLKDNCIIITTAESGTSSISYWNKNTWASGWKISSHFNWVFIFSYCLHDILGMYSGLVWSITGEDLRTPGVSSGVAILAGNIITGSYSPAKYGTSGSIICSTTSRVPSFFEISISCSISIVGMSWRSTIYGSFSAQVNIGSRSVSGSISSICGALVDNIGSRSVSGYIRSMCGAPISPASTPVISRSPIGRLL